MAAPHSGTDPTGEDPTVRCRLRGVIPGGAHAVSVGRADGAGAVRSAAGVGIDSGAVAELRLDLTGPSI